MSDTLDLLVLGGGACGLAAALSAHDAGGRVAIIEGREVPGGNSALSTGSIPGAGTRYQAAAGIEDSPERMVADLRALTGPHDAEDLLELVAAECGPLCEWLIEEIGVRMELITAYRHLGHSVERLHAPRSRRGQDLVDDLLKAVSDRGIPMALGRPAERLCVRDDHVTGAVVDGEEIPARAVLLATNGFAADRDLVSRHCPEIAGAEYFGAPGSTGDALRWASGLGATMGNMAAYQGYAAVVYPQGQLLSWTTIEKGGVLVGADGRRFGPEDLGYSGFARHVKEQGEFAWAVFDARIHEIALDEEEYAEMSEMGALKWSDTPQALADALGIDGGGLAASLQDYSDAAAAGRDALGRRAFGLAPLRPPYAGVKVKPGLFHTQGGPLVDAHARVRRRSGGVVPGLFAGGGAAAGISGRDGALGYASGNGLITALVLGRRAGLRAVADARGTG